MSLVNLLTDRKNKVAERWRELVVSTYPAGTQVFLNSKKDQFANPVGHSLRTRTLEIIEGLVEGRSCESMTAALDELVRVRAVQEFRPATAVGFIFLIKAAVREVLSDVALDSAMLSELLAFESRVDDLALLGFTIYVACREKLYEMRANEIRNRTHRLLERADLLKEVPDFSSEDTTEIH